MTPELKPQIKRTALFIAGGLAIAVISNRVLAYFAGGDMELFNDLLWVTVVLVPVAGLFRLLRKLKKR